MSFYVFDGAGRIVRILYMNRANAEQQTREGEFLGEGPADDLAHYVLDGVLADRPRVSIQATEMPADGVERLVAADLPVGTAVVIGDADPVQVLDGEVSWIPVEPGTWRVRIEPPFPWREETVWVQVHEVSDA